MKCAKCGHEIDDCAFCDEPDCRTPTCYHCIAVALTERPEHPLDYGG